MPKQNFMHSDSDHAFFGTLEHAIQWATECRDLGWLKAADVERISCIDGRSPASLFRSNNRRPLVVAFFGGTGVGKSTLLNRLAGREIARTGAVRPTSREITLYMHASVKIDQLPENFPTKKVRIDLHDIEDMKEILWIDMPDIDSTEIENHKIVLEWLPHIDILIYVVNPDRYDDEKGWQLLLSEGARHAWMFVLNHFDQGNYSQLEAFVKLLANAGFQDPIVFATDCSKKDLNNHDDFRRLKNAIEKLANQHVVDQLELRNLASRLAEIENKIENCIAAMGSSNAVGRIVQKWETIWSDAVNDLDEGMQWPIQEAARSYGISDGGKKLIKQLVSQAEAKEQNYSRPSPNPLLWDDWAQTRFEDALDQILVVAGTNGIPVAPFSAGLENTRSQARNILHSQAEQSLRRSLANPGNSFQRLMLRTSRICSILFPLTAICWVGYEVLVQFHASSISHIPYLGLNFAVHSGLLIFIAWLLPWFALKKLKPSTEKVALKALQNGTHLGYECIKSRIDESLGVLFDQRTRLIQATENIKNACRSSANSDHQIENGTLSQMLSKYSPDESG